MSSMKLSITEKIGFGAGDMAVNIVMITMQLIIAYFYTDIYGLDPADMGCDVSRSAPDRCDFGPGDGNGHRQVS